MTSDYLTNFGFSEEASLGIMTAITAAGLEWLENLPIYNWLLESTENMTAEQAAAFFLREYAKKDIIVNIERPKKGGKRK